MMQESADMELVRMVYTTELARIRYLLRAYLRTRLAKIEQFVMHILDNLGARAAGGAESLRAQAGALLRRCRTPLTSARSAGGLGSRAPLTSPACPPACPDVKDRLSPKEDSYAQGYLVLLGGHLRAAAADHLPPAFASIVRQAAAHPSKVRVCVCFSRRGAAYGPSPARAAARWGSSIEGGQGLGVRGATALQGQPTQPGVCINKPTLRRRRRT